MLANDPGTFGPHRQRGATLLGMLTIGLILALGLYGGIRLVPLYLEYMNVARAMEQVATDLAGTPTNAQSIRASLGRRWEIDDIKSLAPADMEIMRDGGVFQVRAFYRAEAPFIANVSLVVDFDKTVSIAQ